MPETKMEIVNRGTYNVPFGFVYADEDTRACFSVTDGKLTVGGSGSGYFKQMTADQKLVAATLLAERFNFVIQL